MFKMYGALLNCEMYYFPLGTSMQIDFVINVTKYNGIAHLQAISTTEKHNILVCNPLF